MLTVRQKGQEAVSKLLVRTNDRHVVQMTVGRFIWRFVRISSICFQLNWRVQALPFIANTF